MDRKLVQHLRSARNEHARAAKGHYRLAGDACSRFSARVHRINVGVMTGERAMKMFQITDAERRLLIDALEVQLVPGKADAAWLLMNKLNDLDVRCEQHLRSTKDISKRNSKERKSK